MTAPASSPALELRSDGADVAELLIHGTGAGNVLGGAFWEQLPLSLGEINHDSSFGAVIVRSAGTIFSAGMDLGG